MFTRCIIWSLVGRAREFSGNPGSAKNTCWQQRGSEHNTWPSQRSSVCVERITKKKKTLSLFLFLPRNDSRVVRNVTHIFIISNTNHGLLLNTCNVMYIHWCASTYWCRWIDRRPLSGVNKYSNKGDTRCVYKQQVNSHSTNTFLYTAAAHAQPRESVWMPYLANINTQSYSAVFYVNNFNI